MEQQTAVSWFADKYNLVTWLRNRDEISPETADEMRKSYLEQAKQIEKEHIIKATLLDLCWEYPMIAIEKEAAEKYYNDTYTQSGTEQD